MVKMVTEIKKGRNWVLENEEWVVTDKATVYERLAQDLIAKKINQCTYIKSIRRVPNYNGTQTITIYYGDNVRNIYTIDQH